jgi:hypothetical protein
MSQEKGAEETAPTTMNQPCTTPYTTPMVLYYGYSYSMSNSLDGGQRQTNVHPMIW